MADPKARRPRARATAVVIGAIEENAVMLAPPSMATPEFAQERGMRLLDLLDELRRSLNRTTEDANGE